MSAANLIALGEAIRRRHPTLGTLVMALGSMLTRREHPSLR